jgi:hypothetical protein
MLFMWCSCARVVVARLRIAAVKAAPRAAVLSPRIAMLLFQRGDVRKLELDRTVDNSRCGSDEESFRFQEAFGG